MKRLRDPMDTGLSLHSVEPLDLTALAAELELSTCMRDSVLSVIEEWAESPVDMKEYVERKEDHMQCDEEDFAEADGKAERTEGKAKKNEEGPKLWTSLKRLWEAFMPGKHHRTQHPNGRQKDFVLATQTKELQLSGDLAELPLEPTRPLQQALSTYQQLPTSVADTQPLPQSSSQSDIEMHDAPARMETDLHETPNRLDICMTATDHGSPPTALRTSQLSLACEMPDTTSFPKVSIKCDLHSVTDNFEHDLDDSDFSDTLTIEDLQHLRMRTPPSPYPSCSNTSVTSDDSTTRSIPSPKDTVFSVGSVTPTRTRLRYIRPQRKMSGAPTTPLSQRCTTNQANVSTPRPNTAPMRVTGSTRMATPTRLKPPTRITTPSHITTPPRTTTPTRITPPTRRTTSSRMTTPTRIAPPTRMTTPKRTTTSTRLTTQPHATTPKRTTTPTRVTSTARVTNPPRSRKQMHTRSAKSPGSDRTPTVRSPQKARPPASAPRPIRERPSNASSPPVKASPGPRTTATPMQMRSPGMAGTPSIRTPPPRRLPERPFVLSPITPSPSLRAPTAQRLRSSKIPTPPKHYQKVMYSSSPHVSSEADRMAALRRRVTGDTSVDRRMAHLQAIQHELRERRRLDGLQHEENLGALDLLRERRRQALIAQQRKLSMSMRVSKVGDVPRNVKLPRKGLDSPRGIAGGASQM